MQAVKYMSRNVLLVIFYFKSYTYNRRNTLHFGLASIGSLTPAVSAGLAPHQLWINPHGPMLPRVLTRNGDFEPAVCLVPHYLTVF